MHAFAWAVTRVKGGVCGCLFIGNRVNAHATASNDRSFGVSGPAYWWPSMLPDGVTRGADVFWRRRKRNSESLTLNFALLFRVPSKSLMQTLPKCRSVAVLMR